MCISKNHLIFIPWSLICFFQYFTIDLMEKLPEGKVENKEIMTAH